MSYSAKDIKILDGVELSEIPYMEINEISHKYYHTIAPPFIALVTKAWEACQLAGLDFHEFYVEKYLKKNPDIPYSPEFDAIYREM